MAKMKIFIGSASESIELARKIAQLLADNGYSPWRWWEAFPAGSYTLDRLIEIAKSVDGAVFIFTAVDKTWYRNSDTIEPRDNVVLEYGIFAAHLGRLRTLMLKDPVARLPSDVNAITHECITDDPSSVAERAVNHFRSIFRVIPSNTPEAVPLAADSVVVNQLMQPTLPDAWHQRELYIGHEGALSWLACGSEVTYNPKSHERKVRSRLRFAATKSDVRTFVSLGPGDASADRDIAIGLLNKEPQLTYIPVDISDGLLHRAVATMAEDIRIPLAILGDFEDRLPFIFRQLDTYGSHPRLLALLGNTLGNLDGYEAQFLNQIRARMAHDDSLLLELQLCGPSWSREKDRRRDPSKRSPGKMRFIANGVARRTGNSIEYVLRNYAKRIAAIDGRSDVYGGCEPIDWIDTKNHDRRILSVRYYHWDHLKTWLHDEMGFRILDEEQIVVEGDDSKADGVLLLGKR